ncbi:MAG: hypothetical protein SGJ27_03370 [Candidatus Melainabacteria bacterium]|nr:hypothetical protein [Candidatus Melainabacteria bacterium]
MNKSTPESILAVLASDQNSDVRYQLASTSYLPKHVLRQLAADANPHVSQRAKVMLSGLESKVGRMVTVFEFLSEDHGLLASQLRVLVEKYSQWSRDKVFDETVDLFDGIVRHLERQQTLCLDWMEQHEQESESIKRVVAKSTAERNEIKEQISDLLMQHVDGPNFLTSLGQLLERLQAHIEFSESELFSELKRQLPPEELDQVNLRLNQSVLRGESV